MAFFTIARAVFVRILFAIHGLMSIWRMYVVIGDPRAWYITLALAGLLLESIITIWKKKGNEWKWFCPSVLFYLLSVVPSVWFLEVHELKRRVAFKQSLNMTENGTREIDMLIAIKGLEFKLPIKLSSDQWVRALEQLLLLLLIIGRWLLPKGKLSHDQLSQLLLVYIGTAADIVEFFEAFKEKEVSQNELLCKVILSIWSWSLLQFTLVLTATKARKDQSGLVSKQYNKFSGGCCTPDVYGIVISILMQDAPYLVLRMLLIFKFNVLSYTNIFFTCKNTLVIALLMYRLLVIQCGKYQIRKEDRQSYTEICESGSRARLMQNSSSLEQYYNSKIKINLIKESLEDPEETPVHYVIKRHVSVEKMEDHEEENDNDSDKISSIYDNGTIHTSDDEKPQFSVETDPDGSQTESIYENLIDDSCV